MLTIQLRLFRIRSAIWDALCIEQSSKITENFSTLIEGSISFLVFQINLKETKHIGRVGKKIGLLTYKLSMKTNHFLKSAK